MNSAVLQPRGSVTINVPWSGDGHPKVSPERSQGAVPCFARKTARTTSHADQANSGS